MPEMPEVETIARKLRRGIVGKRIQDVWLSGLALRRPIEESFPEQLEGRVIRRIHRRGKYLIVELEPRAYWLIHLGMSGRIFFERDPESDSRHTHARIRFSDATELLYQDHRRFGLMAAYEVPRLGQIPEVQGLGKDPLGPSFVEAWLWSELGKSKQEIKSYLLDQRKVAGLGNIYASEALFLAGIHPARRCHTLTRREAGALVQAVRLVLRAAVRHRGTSFSDFVDSEGRPGGHQDFLNVYQREGEGCHRCRGRIVRLQHGNRSSFFCPQCQKPKRFRPSLRRSVNDRNLSKMPAL